jgi:hypothetical protein
VIALLQRAVEFDPKFAAAWCLLTANLSGNMGVNDETAEAIADWHYWIAQGRQF